MQFFKDKEDQLVSNLEQTGIYLRNFLVQGKT
jgi:hypothetical protein